MTSVKSEVEKIIETHRLEYETSPDIVVSCPGFIRLAGEYTTNSGGLSISMPTEQRMFISVSSRRDTSVRFYQSNLNERKRTNLSNLKFKKEDRWANFIKAAMSVCIESASGNRGYNITVYGNIMPGIGLSSSVALQCAAMKAFSIATGKDASIQKLASRIVESEKTYFDRKSFAADYLPALADCENSCVYVDASQNEVEIIQWPFSEYLLLITDSKIPSSSLKSEIIEREESLESGLQVMKAEAKKNLRDFSVDDLEEYMGMMEEKVRRHCVFFVEEIERVKELKEALLSKDVVSFSRTINKSQAGLRNNYELSCPEIDWLVKRSLEIPGVNASRMIGKGFGSCILTMMPAIAKAAYFERLEEYERIFGFKAQVLEISIGLGMIVSQ